MNNPLTKHVPSNHSWYIVLLALMLAAVFFFATAAGDETDISYIHPAQAKQGDDVKEVTAPISGAKGYTMRVTGFSDVECGSNWCNKHEPKDGQVALNFKKYGRHDKVFIPAFDKTYRVVGTTDGLTDLDIWFGQDQQAALDFGSKQLLVNIL